MAVKYGANALIRSTYIGTEARATTTKLLLAFGDCEKDVKNSSLIAWPRCTNSTKSNGVH